MPESRFGRRRRRSEWIYEQLDGALVKWGAAAMAESIRASESDSSLYFDMNGNSHCVETDQSIVYMGE